MCSTPNLGDTDRLKLFLYYIGKARDVHANGMAEEFVKRTSRYMACEMREIQPGRFDLFARHATARKVFLDPAGKLMDSAAFSALVGKAELEARAAEHEKGDGGAHHGEDERDAVSAEVRGDAGLVTFTLGRRPGDVGRRSLLFVWESGQWKLAHMHASTALAEEP